MKTWEACKNLLAIRLDNMGDVIMSNAAFREMKLHYPGAKLTLLTSSAAAPIVPYLETVDDCVIFDVPWVKLDESDQPASVLNLVETLKGKQCDGCIIFTVYSQSSLPTALLAYLAGIPLRAAYARENPYHLLTHWMPDPEPLSEINHQIYRDLALLEKIGITPDFGRLPHLAPLAAPETALPAHLETASNEPYVLVNMDVSEEKRRFDPLAINTAIRGLLSRGQRVLFTGQTPNSYLASCINDIDHPRLINAVGQTSLPQLLYLVNRAQGVITVNTGVAHIACAYDRPVLVLYAKTNPQHIPWSSNCDYIIYDIPAASKSKNQIIQYVDQTQSLEDYPLPSAIDILERYDQLIENEKVQTL